MLIVQYMESIGNDFVVIDGVTQLFEPSSGEISKLLNFDHEFSVDQIMLILPPDNSKFDFQIKIFNQDGSEAENCVNGIRCISKYIFDQKLVFSDQINFMVGNDLVIVSNTKKNLLKVDMFNISFESEDIGIRDDTVNSFNFNDKEIFFDIVSVGNPHAVIFNYDKEFNIPEVGAALQNSGIFKHGVNVGFANCINDSEINLRVVERGVGETQACGSGACAAAIIGRKTKNLNEKVKVNFNNGFLETETDLTLGRVSLTGDADYRAKAVTLDL